MKDIHPLLFVLASAALYGLGVPLAKILLRDVAPVGLAGLLYLGAFMGLSVLGFIKPDKREIVFERKDLPWLAGVVVCGGVLAPAFLMLGLSQVSGSAASLLLNLEGVATALIASVFFREFTGRRFWLALLCMTAAGISLSWGYGASAASFTGPAFIVAAMFFWGVDNNFTGRIRSMTPVGIARVKCLVAGAANLGIGFWLGAQIPPVAPIVFSVLVGTLSYGASVVLYIHALNAWGAARTGAFFSAAPFIGAVSSVLILGEALDVNLVFAFCLMAVGAWLIASEKHAHMHRHGRLAHSHEHYHGGAHRHEH